MILPANRLLRDPRFNPSSGDDSPRPRNDYRFASVSCGYLAALGKTRINDSADSVKRMSRPVAVDKRVTVDTTV
jgi:hypothetical protein